MPEPALSAIDVFISYSSRDRDAVVQIADTLERAGVRLWLDRARIAGGANYGPEIVRGIRDCKVLMLMCSDAALRSRNVKQEIQLAWKYGRPYLPVLLEPVSFPEQVEYWLEGWQWVEVFDRPTERWLPAVLQALAGAGAGPAGVAPAAPRPPQPGPGLEGLRAIARFTDQIWPVPYEAGPSAPTRSAVRGLGAPQDNVEHAHRVGSRVCLAIESSRPGHLLLLDEGPEGTLYCLCPSWFAPDTRLAAGRTYLPQAGSRYRAFRITGRPGREQLLAVIADEPVGLDWMPADPGQPARVLTAEDVGALLAHLRALDASKWTAMATYFDLLPGA